MQMMTKTLTAITALALMSGHSQAAVLFADDFNRANNTDLNAVTTGKSGTLGALNWAKRTVTGTSTPKAEVNSNKILLGESGSASAGLGIAYVNHNFTDALIATNGQFSVSVDLASVTSSGNTRFSGFGVGNSKAELDAWTSNLPSGSFTSDFFMGYDPTSAGTAVGTYIYKNGTTQDYYSSTARAVGTTLSATFSFANFNSGTTVNYQAFINGSSVKTGSFTWSGTNENYIFLYSNYTNNSGLMDNFEVSVIPEPGSLLLLGLGGLLALRRRR